MSRSSLLAALTPLCDHFKTRAADLTEAQHTLDELEQLLQTLLGELGRDVLELTLPGQDVTADAVEYQGQRYNKAGCHEKQYQTSFGPVNVKRHIYRNRSTTDPHCICPFEIQSGIVNGYWTPIAAEMASFTMTELPSERSATLINKLTAMSVCSSSLDRLIKQVGTIWESRRADFELKLLDRFEVPANATSVAVSLDGVLIPTRCTRVLPSDSRYEEASCGTISFFDNEGERLKTIQYARSPEHKKATLKSQLKQAMDNVLKKNPSLTVIKLADGTADNWTFLEEEIKGHYNVIDFYHAAEHLKAGLNAYFGIKNGKSATAHATYCSKLKHNKQGATQVLHYLEALSREKPKNKTLAEQVTYFRRNKSKMAYAEIQAAGLPIGSGIVEAACKTVVTQRLKLSGMHWDYTGAQAVLSLRAANQSNWFEPAFELIHENLKGNIIPLKKIARENYQPMRAAA